MREYFRNVFIACSQLLHALAGGDPKMTTSARLGKQVVRGESWAKRVCSVISFVLRDPDHCRKVYNSDWYRRMREYER